MTELADVSKILENIISLIPAPIYWADKDGYILGANEHVLNALGVNDLNYFVGRNLYEIYPKNIADKIKKHNDEVFRTGTIMSQIETIIDFTTKQKKHFTAFKNPIKDKNNVVICIIGVSIDITEQKKYEDPLEMLKKIVPLIPSPIYWEDCNNVIIGANQLVVKESGVLSLDDYIGKHLTELYPIELADKIGRHNTKVMKSGKILSQEEEIRDVRTGKQKFYTAVKAPLRDENGVIIGIVGTSIDITKLKRREFELIKAKEAAEAANQAKTEFLANMRHDIRTSLSGIVGFSEILSQQLSDPKFKEYAQNLVASAQSLHVLMDEILESIIVSTGEIPLLKKKFSLSDTLTSITQLYAAKAAEKQLELTLSIAETLPKFIIGDKIRFHRIILELVGNALNFTAIGHVAIRSVSAEMRQI